MLVNFSVNCGPIFKIIRKLYSKFIRKSALSRWSHLKQIMDLENAQFSKSNEITAACYAINWNDLDLVNQKLLITIMERAKRPVELNALGVFKLNLSTMVTILRTSYSYFAVLQQIYKK
ncbi:odorant receptor 30a-like isoform X4 [Rhynchophorus ferrugineus]|uniref:odorant receptor 30a-like isoform X4 n=1 Tax=Rhynchophorus ferrugineus TaxID=354439 RepID=UPI003FCE71C1